MSGQWFLMVNNDAKWFIILYVLDTETCCFDHLYHCALMCSRFLLHMSNNPDHAQKNVMNLCSKISSNSRFSQPLGPWCSPMFSPSCTSIFMLLAVSLMLLLVIKPYRQPVNMKPTLTNHIHLLLLTSAYQLQYQPQVTSVQTPREPPGVSATGCHWP